MHQTEFSDPWDSSQWEHLLNKSNIDPIVDDNTMHINRCKSFKEKLDPLLCELLKFYFIIFSITSKVNFFLLNHQLNSII